MKTKSKKEKLIPELRFSEFKEEWNKTSLEDIASIIPGYAFKSQKMQRSNGKYQILKMANIYKSSLAIDRSPSFWNDLQESLKKYLLRAEDIVLTLTGTVGKQDYGYSVQIPISNKFLLNQRLVCIREISRISDHGFLGNYIQTRGFLRKFFASSRGGTGNQSNVGVDDLKNIKINYPPLPEQQKISSFLSLIDRKIELLNKKKELLEIYKKGVMQKIFNRDIRFKDINGNNYPEWEEKRLGEILEERNIFANQNDGYEHLSLSKEGVTPKTEQYNRDFLVRDKNKKYKITRLKDICYNPANLKFGVICMNTYGEGIFSPIYITYNIKQGNVDFIANLVTQSSFIQRARRFEEGTVYERQAVNPSDFIKIKVSIPVIKEQEKISSIIKNITEERYLLEQRISLTNSFKTSLLQKMFI